jgi:hypothetical protein
LDASVCASSGLSSPLVTGIIVVEPGDQQIIANALKNFEVRDDYGNVWPCRALPYDKNHKSNKTTIINGELNKKDNDEEGP